MSGSRANKKTLRAAERDKPEFEEEGENWRDAAAGIAPKRLVFLDESAALTNLTRTCPPGCGSVPAGTAVRRRPRG